MEIKRIDDYNDYRFDKKTLNCHCAYIIDNKYSCRFSIISVNSDDYEVMCGCKKGHKLYHLS